MKQLKIALFAIGILMLSVICFYTFNLIFSLVSNYEALDIVSFSSLPLVLIFINLMIILISGYRYFMKKEPDIYYARYYTVVVGAISIVGIGMSIFTGTAIYHSFIKDYVFTAYPLISLIVHCLMLGGAVYLYVVITKKIKAENIVKTYKGTFVYGLREAGLSLLFIFALERLGAFVLIPIYWSSYDSVYSLPYLFQLLMPSMVMITYIIHEDFLRNRKVTFILSLSTLGFSLATMVYMICMSHGNYPLTLNSLSMIQQLERLVTFPVGAIIMYCVCIIIPFFNALNNGIMMLKEKKSK